MNKQSYVNRKVLLASSLVLAMGLAGCGDDDNGGQAGQAGGGADGQVERLARPAINEGLLLSNDLLNLFNSVPPSADLTPAAQPILEEATKTLNAFDGIDGKEDITVDTVVKGFLPDVMRIDTRLDIPPGTPAYNAALSGDQGILIGGRKIEDDTIDITLSYLVAGDPTGQAVKDGVSVEGVEGNPAQPGKKLLIGQSSHHGPATFPFLADPFQAGEGQAEAGEEGDVEAETDDDNGNSGGSPGNG